MRNRTRTLGALAVATALTLTGCTAPGGGSENVPSSAPQSASAAAQADVDFAMNMIAHHEQAIEMSDVLLEKEGIDPEVADLAKRIKAAQQPEIETMRDWLSDWGQDPGMDGMHHDGGMMSEDDMDALAAADGAAASRLFLEQMIMHHEGAVEMTQQELSTGKDADALEFAQRMIDDLTAEIDEMRSMLDTL
ncbi:DUF305 domain-containing protein [Microbacterium sp.]|uniref:DUF305 domain-containing protein n=1 Tax=Microbacterium sp. TaxID=51671 RepID=UPI0028AFF5C3|nr:DUF305 domain-containing protein [Microbacterium sp.]